MENGKVSGFLAGAKSCLNSSLSKVSSLVSLGCDGSMIMDVKYN